MTKPNDREIEEPKKSATLSAAVTEEQLVAASEHAWRRRMSLGALVREAVAAEGYFTMPHAVAEPRPLDDTARRKVAR